VGGQPHDPAALPLGKTRYPPYRRLGGPQERSGSVWKNSPPTGIRSPDRPVRSKSLYGLSYPGPHRVLVQNTIQNWSKAIYVYSIHKYIKVSYRNNILYLYILFCETPHRHYRWEVSLQLVNTWVTVIPVTTLVMIRNGKKWSADQN